MGRVIVGRQNSGYSSGYLSGACRNPVSEVSNSGAKLSAYHAPDYGQVSEYGLEFSGWGNKAGSSRPIAPNQCGASR